MGVLTFAILATTPLCEGTVGAYCLSYLFTAGPVYFRQAVCKQLFLYCHSFPAAACSSAIDYSSISAWRTVCSN